MSLLNKPNLLSMMILGAVVLVAGGYGIVTYTQGPEMEHYVADPDYHFPFNFEQIRVTDLPKELVEISGLTHWKKDGQVLGVQDEDGKLFVVNTASGDILEEFKFGKDRDYEGVASIKNKIFVLERDGDIHYINYVEGEKDYEAKKLETDFSYRNDTEGICSDPVTGELLIVPKEQELNPVDGGDARHGIYSYNLTERRLNPQPSFFVDEFEVGEVVYGKRKPYHFKPSGIAVDPVSKDVYVIASVGNIMVVIDRESEVKHIELLKEKTFKQPEGICFDSKGNLFISSEGRGGKAIIARFTRSDGVRTKKPADE